MRDEEESHLGHRAEPVVENRLLEAAAAAAAEVDS